MKRRHFLAGGIGIPLTASIAQAVGQTWRPQTAAALCVGVANYPGQLKLNTPLQDAKAVARAFSDLGYSTHISLDPTMDQLLDALAQFRVIARDADLACIYIAGHGFMSGGEFRYLPVDHASAQIALPERLFLRAIADKPRHKVLMIDACRQVPEALTALNTPEVHSPFSGLAGAYSAYAAQPGSPAFDGASDHSPFADALIDLLGRGPQDIDRFFQEVRVRVIRQTSGLQIPWTRSSLLSPLSLQGRTV